jgi:hypothetical protein
LVIFGLSGGVLGVLLGNISRGALGDVRKYWVLVGAFGLAVSLVLGLISNLAVDWVVGLPVGLAIVWVGVLVVGLQFGLRVGLAGVLIVGLQFGLVYGLVGGLARGLAGGLGVVIIYLLHYLLARFYGSRLERNTYQIFDRIDVSLFLEQRFIAQTHEDPILALQFVDFLWQHRSNQHNLAALLAHVAFAEQWKNEAIGLKEQTLSFPLTREQKSFDIPVLWEEQLTAVKGASHTAQTTSQISLKVDLFNNFITALEALYKSTLVAPQKTWWDISMTRRINWYTYYSEALEEWLKVAREEYAELQEKAKQYESIATNKYQTGGALSATYNQDVFMQRDDLKEKLATLLYTTQNFSVFFLQGQRRVGKTSLLKFMPQILGNRFKVVNFSLQGRVTSAPDFLAKWHATFCQHFGLKNVVFAQQATWGETFAETLAPLFKQTAKDKNCKIILALDEYEELHEHLSKDTEQAAALLGAIRHFTQHQSEVSIMFVGLQFFSELQNPNWNEYFPQSVPIKVEYLNRAKTYQLIEVSTLDFEDGMKQRIYDLTQGHPSLIQKICYELVQIANRDGRRRLTFKDLDESLTTMIYIPVNGVTDIFWTQNCNQAIDKEIVWAVIEQRAMPPNARQRLRRLIEYGFILEEGNSYRMRVPIFETWVKRFG